MSEHPENTTSETTGKFTTPDLDFKAPQSSSKNKIATITIFFSVSILAGFSYYIFVSIPNTKRELAIKKQNDEYEQQRLNFENKILDTIKTMTQEIERSISSIKTIKQKQLKLNGLRETDMIVSDNGQFTLAGLESIKYDEQIDVEIELINKQKEKIENVAQQNNINNHPKFIELFAKYKNMSEISVDASGGNNYPPPSPTDIGILNEFAKQLRSAIRSAPRPVPNGDATYNSIVGRANSEYIAPVANQFNRACNNFSGKYGHIALKQVASQNGFSDLLPPD